MPTHDSTLLTVPELAKKLKVAPRTIYRHAADWPFLHRLPGTELLRANWQEAERFFAKKPRNGKRRKR